MIFVKDRTYLYYTNVSRLNLDEAYKCLPSFRQKKVDNLLQEKDKKLSAGVYILLSKALAKHDLNINDYEFKIQEGGKPYLDGCPYEISYSHSGEYALVGLSKKPIGVDIQEMKEIQINITKLVFNDTDIKKFTQSGSKEICFYQIWCLKESYAKAIGNAISKDTIVDYRSKNNFTKKYKNYMIAAKCDEKVKISEIKL